MYRFLCVLFLLLLAACSTSRAPDLAVPPPDDVLPTGDQGGAEKVGTPYKVAGQWYYPKEDPSYDQTGMASWYGDQFHGRRTANGETFNMNALTAAHKTLPMPSFVKVTNLENGRVLVLRVNDRGPFVDDRLIDVSRRAAQMLGFADRGLTRVRIQASDQKGRVIEAPKRAAKQADVIVAEATPTAAAPATSAPAPGTMSTTEPTHEKASPQQPEQPASHETKALKRGRFFLQLGAYSEIANANKQLARAEASGLSAMIDKTMVDERAIYRVRLGPYPDRESAERQRQMLQARGFVNARIALGNIE